MYGLFNNPNVRTEKSQLDWNAAETTADDIIEDLNKGLEKVWIDSMQTYVPNTLLIDSARYTKLAKTRLSQYNETTLLDYFKEHNVVKGLTAGGGTVDVRPLAQLSGSELKANKVSTTGKSRMVIYDRNPLNMSAYMPIAPRFLAPQAQGLKIITPMEFKCSGTEVRYPNAMVYIEEK